jgi:hypothetical protein
VLLVDKREMRKAKPELPNLFPLKIADIDFIFSWLQVFLPLKKIAASAISSAGVHGSGSVCNWDSSLRDERLPKGPRFAQRIARR